jgi:membrane-associated phospholipid phosphatase
MLRTHLSAVMLAVALLAPTAPPVHARGMNADVLFEWNQLLQDTITTAPPPLNPRYYAMMHIAMFDAINAFAREYAPFHVRLRDPRSGSPAAAAAQAAHDVLVVINAAAAPQYDALLAQQLGPDPSPFVRTGAALGARVAKEVLAWRQNDHFLDPFVPYVEPLLPGRWQPTPPNNPAPQFTQFQTATPMALLTPTQYLPLPPPTLISERYAVDFNEVKLIGKSDSATRSPEQTEIARLWASVSSTGTAGATATPMFAVWNNITRDVIRDHRLSLVDAARVFTLVNVSIHDGIHTTLTSKYVYGLWRPVTAIRNAADDLNAATDPDPTWLPLITTPPYPSYPGNQAVAGAAAAAALARAFGSNDIPVTATWHRSDGPDVSHQFDTFWAAAEEQAMSRIYAGIHYRFDHEASQPIGRSVAEFVFTNFMQPRNGWDDGR